MKSGKTRNAGRRGYALIASLIIILVLLFVGASLFNMADTSARLSSRRLGSAQALNLAMAGADMALLDLRSSPVYTGFAARDLGDGTVSATVTPVSRRTDLREITGIGTVRKRAGVLSRQVRYTVDLNEMPDAFRYSLIVDDDLGMNGNVSVAPSLLGRTVRVHTNANANLSGSALSILGRLTASGDVRSSGNPRITGGTASRVPRIPFPQVDQGLKERAANAGLRLGNVAVGDGQVLSGAIDGNLTISGPSGCKLDGVVWVTGCVSIDGPVTGVGTLVAEGKIDLKAGLQGPPPDSSGFLFVSLSDDADAVSISGNRASYGVIYAPNGGVRARGTPTLAGGIAAKTVDFAGTPNIIGWDGFFQNPPPSPSGFVVLGWQELQSG